MVTRTISGWPTTAIKRLKKLAAPSNRPGLDSIRELSQSFVLRLFRVAGERLCLIRPVLTLVNLGAFRECLLGSFVCSR